MVANFKNIYIYIYILKNKRKKEYIWLGEKFISFADTYFDLNILPAYKFSKLKLF